MGMDIFASIPQESSLVFATAAWQYTRHVLPGMRFHRGPILTIANWSGQWPGLVGLLNLNGSLVKAGIDFSTIWSRDLPILSFSMESKEWLEKGTIRHDPSRARSLDVSSLPNQAQKLGAQLANALQKESDSRCLR